MKKMAGMTRLWMAVALLALGACGGDGGDGTPTSPTPLPSSTTVTFSYPSVAAFTIGQPVAPVAPTVAGATFTSYSITPALPAGMTFEASTGTISGTPTVTHAATTYTVSASGTSSNATTTLTLAVNERPPVIAYEDTTLRLAAGTDVSLYPINTGGRALWSISPALSAGLEWDTSEGRIYGTPTTVSAPTVYQVTAQNSGGQVTLEMSIEVESGVLLDLGHANPVRLIRYTPSRVVTRDHEGHWVLWDAQTKAMLASGDAVESGSPSCENCESSADIAGTTLAIVPRAGLLELRSASNGELRSLIGTTNNWWALATDGSYVCAGNVNELKVWSPSGQLLFTKPGNYMLAKAFADPNEIRVARGAAGQNVLERISIIDGSSTLSPAFIGVFHEWFLDGARFFTQEGPSMSPTLRVYSQAVVLEDMQTLPPLHNLAGRGQWFWAGRQGEQLNIYAVGNSASPAASYFFHGTQILQSANTLGVFTNTDGSMSIIDLSGPTPVKTDPVVQPPRVSAYAALSSSALIFGNENGVVLDGATPPGAPEYFGYGAATSIAGSTERIALSTASGTLLYFNAETKQQEGRMRLPSSKIRLSTEGAVLAVATDSADMALKVFSLPAETEIASWSYSPPSYPLPLDIALSGSGEVFGRVLRMGPSTYSREVTTVTGSPLWSDNNVSSGPIRLSPDGTLIAVADGSPLETARTSIFKNGVLVTDQVTGLPLTWLDDNRLLVNQYQRTRFIPEYVGSIIVDSTGQQLSSLPRPRLAPMDNAQFVAPDLLYPGGIQIFSLTDGAVWQSSSTPAQPSRGALAGGRAIFASGAVVRAEPYE